MEKFFKFFKEKLSLDDEHVYQLRNIVLNENTSLIKQNFNIFYENKIHALNESNFFYCCLFLYCLDIHIEFKKKLLTVISSKLFFIYTHQLSINIFIYNRSYLYRSI